MKTWVIRFGTSVREYYTDYHAAQFCFALAMNGTPYTVEVRP